MKTQSILLGSLFLVLAISACNLIEDLIKIPLKITDEVTVPPLTGINTIVSPATGSTNTNIDLEMELNDSRKNKIKTIKLKECALNIKNSNEDFSFVKDISVFLNAEGQQEVLLGTAKDIPARAKSLKLSVHDLDLSAYLKQEAVSFKVILANKEIVLSPIDIEIFSKFEVTADIF